MSERKASYTTRRFHDPIDDVLDRPIAFNPAFKKITGSTVAALMLSQAWYWSKRTSDDNGWFYKTVSEWEDETGLTRSEQETARKHLKGIMEVELRGVPATLYYRLDKAKILELLGVQFAETLQTRLPETSELVSDNPANINSTETTTENTQRDFVAALLSTKSEKEIEEEEACKAFERALGFNSLPWHSTGAWTKMARFVTEIHRRDRLAFGNYIAWRGDAGKYKAMSNKQIRMNPQVFMDTGWAEFENDSKTDYNPQGLSIE